jgi:hypothetical protein
MLTDFPDARKQLDRFMTNLMREQIKQKAPMMSMVRHRRYFEGDKLSTTYPGGKKDVREFQLVETQFSISKKDAETFTPSDFIGKLAAAADDMAGQIERGIFDTIHQAVTEAGNVLPGNPPLNRESILQALDRVSIDFENDDRLKPVLPSIVVHPILAEKLRAEEAAVTAEEKTLFEARQREILDRKFHDYMTDLESRKLID